MAEKIVGEAYDAICDKCGRTQTIEMCPGVPINRNALRPCNHPMDVPVSERCWGNLIVQPGGPRPVYADGSS